MPDVVLNEREQSALSKVLATEPVSGRPLPEAWVLELIDRLVPCDGLGVCLADNHGYVVEFRELPRGVSDDRPAPTHDDDDGPYYIGFMHWLHHPAEAESCQALWGIADGVSIGFRNGPDHVSQIWFDRAETTFSETDLARLRFLTPVFKRLLRERPTPSLPAELTTQERRVLMEVSAGLSNPEISANLCIAPATVRKHLEHAYRKLGVTNRLAAVVRFNGAAVADPDLQARITGWNTRSTLERV